MCQEGFLGLRLKSVHYCGFFPHFLFSFLYYGGAVNKFGLFLVTKVDTSANNRKLEHSKSVLLFIIVNSFSVLLQHHRSFQYL